MPEWVIGKISEGLNLHKKSINGSRILVLGIAYKKNVDDMRESPSVAIMQLLENRGADIDYSDPHVPIFPKMRDYSFELQSVILNQETIAKYDCLVLATNHDAFDYDVIKRSAMLIVDARGVYRESEPNVIKA